MAKARALFFTAVLFAIASAGIVGLAACDTSGGGDKSDGKDIVSFEFASPAASGTIDETSGTISVILPVGTAITALSPTIGISPKASIRPASGLAQDFSGAVTYTVTAEDGSTRAYTVTVALEAPTIASITPNHGYGIVAVTELAGSGFAAGATVTLERSGQGDIAASSVVVASPTKISCSFDLVDKMTGDWDLVVANPDGQSATLAAGFLAKTTAATIASITPSSGYGIISITNLAGTNFAGGSTVKLRRAGAGDVAATDVVVASASKITCSFDLTPATPGVYDAVVTGVGGLTASLGACFTVENSPVITTIDGAGDVGKLVSSALGSDGALRACYYDATNQALKYATNASGSWVAIDIAEGIADSLVCSLECDSDNRTHIAYSAGGNIFYATNATATRNWTIETAASPATGGYPSIALDAAGKAHIAVYRNYGAGVYYTGLYYLTNAGGSWSSTPLQPSIIRSNSYPSILVDRDGTVDVCCYLGLGSYLNLYTNESSAWVGSSIDSAVAVKPLGPSSMVYDSDGKRHILYYHYADNTASSVREVTDASGAWVARNVDTSATYDFGGLSGASYSSLSLAIDSDDKLYASYHDWRNGALMFATDKSGSWATKVFDQEGDVGFYSSINVGPSGTVHILYYDSTHGDLKYLTY